MGNPNKSIKSVRIVNLASVPPKFILRPRVIKAVRQEVIADLKHGLKRVPSGVEVDYQPDLFHRLLRKVGLAK